MNRKLGLIWLAMAVVGLSGCATMSADECMTSDWTAVGYGDGARGYSTDRHAKYRKSCAKDGVTPDFSAYMDGRERGLVEYCQPSRGFNVGSNGGRYNGVCSVNLEADFLDAYNAGYHLYTLRSNVNRATSSINSKENELERIEDQLLKHGVAIIGADTTIEERILIVADMKDLAERTGQLQTEVRDLYEIRARSQVELEHYQMVVADLGY